MNQKRYFEDLTKQINTKKVLQRSFDPDIDDPLMNDSMAETI